jgi:hypothetical protein
MEQWRSESSPGKQTAAAIGCTVVGVVLAYGFRDFTGPGMSNTLAGFLLGILLLVIGAAGLVMRGTQSVVVDPRMREITIEDKNCFGTKKRKIRFIEITGTGVGFLGKESNRVTFYYVLLKLRSGDEYPLFAPGRFYKGATDRHVVEGWRERLETCMRS